MIFKNVRSIKLYYRRQIFLKIPDTKRILGMCHWWKDLGGNIIRWLAVCRCRRFEKTYAIQKYVMICLGHFCGRNLPAIYRRLWGYLSLVWLRETEWKACHFKSAFKNCLSDPINIPWQFILHNPDPPQYPARHCQHLPMLLCLS